MALDQMAQAPQGGAPTPQGATRMNAGADKPASDLEHLDLEIAVKLGTKLLMEAGGLDVIKKGLDSSGDPAQVVSKFLVQLIMQIKEAIDSQGVELSPNIVLGKGGWVDQMLDLIEGELGLPATFSDDVFADVMETFKAMAQQPQQGGQPPQQGAQPPAQGAPMPPQGGGLQGVR